MAEDLGERTEEPTGRRLGEARDRGQVGKSAELSAALALAAGFALLYLFLAEVFFGMGAMVRRGLSAESVEDWVNGSAIMPESSSTALEAARLVVPLLVIAAAVAYVIGLSQVGFLLSSKILNPNLERLNVIKGMGKLISLRSVVKGGLDTLKLSLIGGVMLIFVWSKAATILALPALSLAQGSAVVADLVRDLALWVLAVLIILGFADWFYQRWQHRKDLRMTRQEVKDEHRTDDGDPALKGRRIKLARQIALQRINAAVPKADVVVTNPTHFSVALKYDADTMKAPRVLAKGADFLAMRIRTVAASHGVPIVERPPLARALYAEALVGREVHPKHYEAVAEVLAYVYRLEGRAAAMAKPSPLRAAGRAAPAGVGA